MIIKSKRIRARGPALKRALAHISNTEDNDEVVLLRGNPADLEDARADAMRFGRQYCVRHFILSPEQKVTEQQLDEALELLAAEFEFDATRGVLWGHTKDRATTGRATDGGNPSHGPRHFHYLVAEVDPISGRVMSSAHDWDRQSKCAKICEVRWGHDIVPAPRMRGLIAALERDGDHVTAEALLNVAEPDHPASFGEAEHQRAQRLGVDLPLVRDLLAQALKGASSRDDLDSRLARVRLRLRAGDRKDVLLVETADGTLIGSFARLVRLRKKALDERLAFLGTETLAAPSTKHPPGDLSDGSPARPANGAGSQNGGSGRRAERERPNGHGHRVAAARGRRSGTDPLAAGGPGSSPRRSGGQKGNQGLRRPLNLDTSGRLTNALLDLIGIARHSALPPLERTVSSLNDVIERETVAGRETQLPEPASLSSARRLVGDAAADVAQFEKETAEISKRLAALSELSIWKRWLKSVAVPERRFLQQLDDLNEKLPAARAKLNSARTVLQSEEKKFRRAQAIHQAGSPDRRARADRQIATARLARTVMEKNPRSAHWGAGRLFSIAAALETSRARAQPDDEPIDLWVPTFDLWGIPSLPPPKIF
ncbi:hypothetical protein ABIB75_007812 [Bradyrhizobium sp. GM2.2]|uniref:hypothetical protein n=1 Tax=Bradyrhizobium sp. GM2.2 TaxID=3156358 RepID=UPI003392F6D8